MPTFMPTASRTVETLAMERSTFSQVSMYCISPVPFTFTAVNPPVDGSLGGSGGLGGTVTADP